MTINPIILIGLWIASNGLIVLLALLWLDALTDMRTDAVFSRHEYIPRWERTDVQVECIEHPNCRCTLQVDDPVQDKPSGNWEELKSKLIEKEVS